MNGYLERGYQFWTHEAIAFESALFAALKGACLVAANPAFDAAFLRARWGESPWHYRLLDVEAYAMPALNLDRPHGLAYIAEQLGVTAPDHSAEQDVLTLRACYLKLHDNYAEAR
jgi:DNA polymerase III epsilon subunit-like protein